MTLTTYALVGVAGGAGATARFLLDRAVSRRTASDLPFGTFAVNISGALLLGLVAGFGLSGDARAVAATGALGGYTTFSTWVFESHRLAEDGRGVPAAANLAGSLLAGLGAVALGRLIAGG